MLPCPMVESAPTSQAIHHCLKAQKMKAYIATILAVLLSTISFNARTAASNCASTFTGYQHPSGPWRWKIKDNVSAILLDPNGDEYGSSSLQRLASGDFYNGVTEEQRTKFQEWARCHLAANKAGPLSDNGKNSTARTGQLGSAQADIPGRHKDGDAVNCPVRAPRDCVQWSEQNPDLHFWNVNNTCNGPIIVIYEDPSVSNGRTLTDWITSGNYQSIKTYSRPRYNVYNAKSVTQFHKSRYNKPGDFMTCVMAEVLR